MKQSKVDPCIFYLRCDSVLVLIVCIYIDGCIVAGEQVYVDCLKQRLKNILLSRNLDQYKSTWECGTTGTETSMVTTQNLIWKILWRAYSKTTRISLGKNPTCALIPGLPGTSLRLVFKSSLYLSFFKFISKVLETLDLRFPTLDLRY